MEAIVKKNPEIRVSHDNMKAYLYLPGSMMDDYTVTDVHEALKRSGVSYGILEGAIQDAIDARMMEREVLVAQGNMPQDGVDGYYEYKFSKDFSKKPKASPDGSVDYWSIKMLETVTEGQEIGLPKDKIRRRTKRLPCRPFSRSGSNIKRLIFNSLLDDTFSPFLSSL